MRNLKYEKVLFGFNPCSGLWGLIDDSLAYEYVNEDIFQTLFNFYANSLWHKKVTCLTELSPLDILKLNHFYHFQYPMEVYVPVIKYTGYQKYNLILGLTQLFNDEYENDTEFWHERNLRYLTIYLGSEIDDYSEVTKRQLYILENGGLILYGLPNEAYHNSENRMLLCDLLRLLINDSDLCQRAIDLILRHKKASVSFIERSLKLNYEQSIFIIQELEKRQIISGPDHSGRRKILISKNPAFFNFA